MNEDALEKACLELSALGAPPAGYTVAFAIPNGLEQWPEIIREAAAAEAQRWADAVDARILDLLRPAK